MGKVLCFQLRQFSSAIQENVLYFTSCAMYEALCSSKPILFRREISLFLQKYTSSPLEIERRPAKNR